MSEHKPAFQPLTYRQYEGEQPPSVFDVSRLPGNFYDFKGNRITQFGSAHAVLFASAPDLLDSLEATAEALNMSRLVMKEQETRDLAGQLVADARAVIARAKGSREPQEAEEGK
jgi:hypothetical protein